MNGAQHGSGRCRQSVSPRQLFRRRVKTIRAIRVCTYRGPRVLQFVDTEDHSPDTVYRVLTDFGKD